MVPNNDNLEPAAVDPAVQSFVSSLDEQHRMLVILKAQLYGGQWQPMLDDLKNRLEGKPYIFKLANRIKDDVDRIDRMQIFEKEHGIDLSDFIKLES